MEEQIPLPGEEAERITEIADEISGENIDFTSGFALQVNAQRDITISEGGGGVIAAGRDSEVNNGGAQVIVAGNDVQIENGGAMIINAGGNVDITNGGGLLVAGQNVSTQNGFVGMVLSQESNIGEGSKVLLNTPQAIAFGAALGSAFALLGWLLRKK